MRRKPSKSTAHSTHAGLLETARLYRRRHIYDLTRLYDEIERAYQDGHLSDNEHDDLMNRVSLGDY